MFRKLATILLGFFIIAVAFGPRLTLANSQPHASCHETPKEMPVSCAVHCLATALNENEVVSVLDFGSIFLTPAIKEIDFNFFVPKIKTNFFLESSVFREIYPILTTIKRE